MQSGMFSFSLNCIFIMSQQVMGIQVFSEFSFAKSIVPKGKGSSL